MAGGGCVRIAVLELVGYREWTESLGSDREWRIQAVQAGVYREGQITAARRGGFLMAQRHDILLLLASGLGPEDHQEVMDAVATLAPVPVRMASSCAPTPREAEARAWRLLQAVGPGGFRYEESGGSEETLVAHIDIDNVTSITRRRGAVETHEIVIKLLANLAEKAPGLGAVIQYLGGDNVLAVLPPSASPSDVGVLLEGNGFSLKAGVGRAVKPRRALSLAAEALHRIRSGEAESRIVYLEDR